MGLKIKFNLLNLTNFTVQLKFLVIILEIMTVTIGAFALSDGFMFYFIVNCSALLATGVLFLASVCDLLKNQEDMRQFEAKFHKAVSILLLFSGFIGIIIPSYHWGSEFRICTYIIGLGLTAPLNLLIGWQCTGFHSTEQFRASNTNFYCHCGFSDRNNDLDAVLTPAPPMYSETGFSNRGKYNESGPIVPLPASHSRGANQFV